MKRVDIDLVTSPAKAVRACIGGTIERTRRRPETILTERFGRIRVHTVTSRLAGPGGGHETEPPEPKIDIQRDDCIDRVLYIDSHEGHGVERAVIIDVEDSTGDFALRPDPTEFARGVTHLFSPWRFVRVPSNALVAREWVTFSHTHDSYWRAGDFEAAAELWNRIRNSGDGPSSTSDLETLRTALFMEARADRHGGGDGQVTDSITALIDRIREVSGGIVRDDRPIHI